METYPGFARVSGDAENPQWQSAGGLGRVAALAMALAGATGASALASATHAPELPTLTTTRQVHSLTAEDSTRAYPIHLRAVVTYFSYDPLIDARHAVLFVCDSTGCIFAGLPAHPIPPLRAGMLVDLRGVSGPGHFAPVVAHPIVRVIGQSHLPAKARRVNVARLLTGIENGQWVEVEGLVRSVHKSGKEIKIELAASDGSLRATMLEERGVDYGRLLDARVLLRGNAAPVFNRKRQMIGVRIFTPRIGDVRVEEPSLADPFSLPVRSIGGLLRFDPGQPFLHRVHVRGRVTLQWPGRSLCVQNGADGICAQTDQTTPVQLGQMADIAGFVSIGQYSPRLTNAIYRASGPATPVAAPLIAPKRALEGRYDSQLVRIDGQLIGRDRAARDPTLILSSGKFLFPVVLPETASGGTGAA